MKKMRIESTEMSGEDGSLRQALTLEANEVKTKKIREGAAWANIRTSTTSSVVSSVYSYILTLDARFSLQLLALPWLSKDRTN